ncbi:MAG: hypothetical protein KTR24_05930 [Saprospiraceae bacterium]|nr:hypothetical protein [Saprospiraceae bacterium]
MENIEKSALRALFWKDEILQILYWMDGEGFGKTVPVPQVLALLNTNQENLLYHLSKLVSEGILNCATETVHPESIISLSENARKEAGSRFAEAFQGYQKAGHGECGPDCEFCYGPNGQKLENCVHNCASAPLTR